MKPSVLLINSYKTPDDARIQLFIDWLSPHFEVKTVHVDNIGTIEVKENGLVISGSERLITSEPVPSSLAKLLFETTKPILGVCYGHQALAVAWGANIVKKKSIEEEEVIRVTHSKGILSNLGLFFNVLESHAEHVVADKHLTMNFEVMAYSDSCKVEVIRHHERPMWGVQFHPERSGQVGARLASNFAQLVSNPSANI